MQNYQQSPSQAKSIDFQGASENSGYTGRIYEAWYFTKKHLQKFIYSSIDQYITANSVVADVGCGTQPMRPYIEAKGCKYIGLDMFQNPKNTVDIICSATSIKLPDCSVEHILCTEVIEHVSDIDKVFSEFSRILKPDGYIILSCPFLFYLHHEPYDFNRPTPFLLQLLADNYRFKVVKLERTGNEIEVVATAIDSVLCQHIFANPIILFIWHILRIFLRLITNVIAGIFSKLIGSVLWKKLYLTNVAILQK